MWMCSLYNEMKCGVFHFKKSFIFTSLWWVHDLLYKHGIGAFYREPSELQHTWFQTLAGVRLFPSIQSLDGGDRGICSISFSLPDFHTASLATKLQLSFKTVDTSANSIVEKEVSHMNFEEQHRLAAADCEIKKKQAANANDYQSEPISFSWCTIISLNALFIEGR